MANRVLATTSDDSEHGQAAGACQLSIAASNARTLAAIMPPQHITQQLYLVSCHVVQLSCEVCFCPTQYSMLSVKSSKVTGKLLMSTRMTGGSTQVSATAANKGSNGVSAHVYGQQQLRFFHVFMCQGQKPYLVMSCQAAWVV